MFEPEQDLDVLQLLGWQLLGPMAHSIVGPEIVQAWSVQADVCPVRGIHMQRRCTITIQAEGAESDQQWPLQGEHELEEVPFTSDTHCKGCSSKGGTMLRHCAEPGWLWTCNRCAAQCDRTLSKSSC